MNKYSINIKWSDEDKSFIATIPEFPGLSAFGETQEEALKEAKTALNGFVEVYEEDNCQLPEPEIWICHPIGNGNSLKDAITTATEYEREVKYV